MSNKNKEKPTEIFAKQKSKRAKVYVGMSGGVDSSVTAALLKEQGYDVTGVFIKAWHPEGMPCNWKEDRRDAMRVCAVLDIPFKTLDLEKEYKQEVVDYMIEEYKKGRTPNPDVMCNKSVKFGGFLKFALAEGADFVATGHYARLRREIPISKSQFPNKYQIQMLEGKDKDKDQSYFLWTLTQDQLKHVLFPIGEYQKNEVRKLAEKFNLPTASKKDSQGLCFLGKVDMKDFLREYIPTEKGNVLNEQGEIVGIHDGAHLYTTGERHGFITNKKTASDAPLYVVSKDIRKNTITVSSDNYDKTKNIFSKVELSQVNWIQNPELKKRYLARFRYHQDPILCDISIEKDGGVTVCFDEPQKAIAEGQSLVLYDSEKCLGGGIIENAQ